MVFYDTWPKVDPKILLWVLLAVLAVDHIWEIILAKRQVSLIRLYLVDNIWYFTRIRPVATGLSEGEHGAGGTTCRHSTGSLLSRTRL